MYHGPIALKPIEKINPSTGQIEVQSLMQVLLDANLPKDPLRDAMDYFDQHKNIISNTRYLSLVNFSLSSADDRFFVIDLSSGDMQSTVVAHGKGSDPKNTGFAQRFSNISGSNMSSLGFYLVSENYFGKWGLSIRLDGLSATNSRVRDRAIVMHGASYVHRDRQIMGRSEGCFAIPLSLIEAMMHRLSGGSLLYAFTEDN